MVTSYVTVQSFFELLPLYTNWLCRARPFHLSNGLRLWASLLFISWPVTHAQKPQQQRFRARLSNKLQIYCVRIRFLFL